MKCPKCKNQMGRWRDDRGVAIKNKICYVCAGIRKRPRKRTEMARK